MITRGCRPVARSSLRKKWIAGEPLPLRLHENVEDHAVLIDSSPEIVSDAVDLEEDFVQMPFVAGLSAPSSQAVNILFAELIAPAPDRFVADQHSTCGHHLFYIAKAHAETEVVPDAFRNDFSREPVATVRVVRHSSSIASGRSPGQCDKTHPQHNSLRRPKRTRRPVFPMPHPVSEPYKCSDRQTGL